MINKVLHGCKETKRVILQQTKAHLNESRHVVWILYQLHFQFPFQMNLLKLCLNGENVLTRRLSIKISDLNGIKWPFCCLWQGF